MISVIDIYTVMDTRLFTLAKIPKKDLVFLLSVACDYKTLSCIATPKSFFLFFFDSDFRASLKTLLNNMVRCIQYFYQSRYGSPRSFYDRVMIISFPSSENKSIETMKAETIISEYCQILKWDYAELKWNAKQKDMIRFMDNVATLCFTPTPETTQEEEEECQYFLKNTNYGLDLGAYEKIRRKRFCLPVIMSILIFYWRGNLFQDFPVEIVKNILSLVYQMYRII